MIMSIPFAASPAWAASESVESTDLRVAVTTDPYSFCVTEKVTGERLVCEDSVVFSLGPELYPVSKASNLRKASQGLEAELPLELAGRDPLRPGAPDRARVWFTFVEPSVLRVEVSYEGASQISEEFKDQGEHYYGIWEYPFGGNIDNRGADRDFRGIGNERYVHHSSARAPFYLTSRKYGIYVESLAFGHYSIAQAGKTSFSFNESHLKYDIIYGPSSAEIFARYNRLAGPSVMPPLWAFGSIWWRDDEHEDLRDAQNAQEKVIQDADRLRALHIPASAIWLDRPYASGDQGWGNLDFDASFPNPPKMIRDLNDRGMNLLVWTANRVSGKMFEEGSAKKYLYPGRWPAAEIARPEVYEWFKHQLNAYVRLGIKGYKIDRGEEGEVPLTDENQLSVLFPKLSAESLKDRNGNDYFMFARNANDTARKYTAVWNGDSWSTFSGLETTVKNALRAGAINFPLWGSDTGGYFAPGERDQELLARWLEFSAFSPVMEVILGPKRTLWYDYDDALVNLGRKYTVLHHDLIPYTRSYMYEATETGMPVMRSLAFASPDDESLSDMWDEYLYGRDLLVAPVTKAQMSERKVYLPAGRWMDYNDKDKVYEGKNTITAPSPLDTIPVFVREGAIIPRGDIVRLNNNWEPNWSPKLGIEVFPARIAPSRFEYFTGAGVRTITVTPQSRQLAIQFDDLGVPGSLHIYCAHVDSVTKNGARLRQGADYEYDAKTRMLTVPFQGATVLAIQGAESVFDKVMHQAAATH